jgi:hypothetical protein
MRALTVEPNTANSPRPGDVAPPPQAEPDDLKVVRDFTQ